MSGSRKGSGYEGKTLSRMIMRFAKVLHFNPCFLINQGIFMIFFSLDFIVFLGMAIFFYCVSWYGHFFFFHFFFPMLLVGFTIPMAQDTEIFGVTP